MRLVISLALVLAAGAARADAIDDAAAQYATPAAALVGWRAVVAADDCNARDVTKANTIRTAAQACDTYAAGEAGDSSAVLAPKARACRVAEGLRDVASRAASRCWGDRDFARQVYERKAGP